MDNVERGMLKGGMDDCPSCETDDGVTLRNVSGTMRVEIPDDYMGAHLGEMDAQVQQAMAAAEALGGEQADKLDREATPPMAVRSEPARVPRHEAPESKIVSAEPEPHAPSEGRTYTSQELFGETLGLTPPAGGKSENFTLHETDAADVLGFSPMTVPPDIEPPVIIPWPGREGKRYTDRDGHVDVTEKNAWPADEQKCGWTRSYKTLHSVELTYEADIFLPWLDTRDWGKTKKALSDLIKQAANGATLEQLSVLPFTLHKPLDQQFEEYAERWLQAMQNKKSYGPLNCEEPCVPVVEVDYYTYVRHLVTSLQLDLGVIDLERDVRGKLLVLLKMSVIYEVGLTVSCDEVEQEF